MGTDSSPFRHDVLSNILLFLPVDLPTLLAASHTCRSWRYFANYLPHWSHLGVIRPVDRDCAATLPPKIAYSYMRHHVGERHGKEGHCVPTRTMTDVATAFRTGYDDYQATSR